MVEFREATAGTELVNWGIINDVVSFGRGDIGHIAINTGSESVRLHLPTSLAPGRYSGIVNGAAALVDGKGIIEIALEPQSFVAVLDGQSVP